MGQTEHSQQSFAGGVLSPRFFGREGSEFYQAALAECHNLEITPQGSLMLRGGTVFARYLGEDARARLVPFPQSDGQGYLVLLTDEKIRLFGLNGALPFQAGASGLSFLVNGDFASGTESWTVTETDDIHSWVRFINGDATLRGERFNSDTWRAEMHQDFTPANAVAATLKIAWKKVSGRVKNVTVRVSRGGTTIVSWSKVPTAGTVTELAVPLEAGQTYRLSIKLDLPSGSLTDKWNASVVVDWVSLGATSGGTEPVYELDAPWTAEQIRDVHWAVEPGRNRVYFVHPNVQPWFLSLGAAGVWTWAPCTFVSAPSEWAEGNWPSVVEYYQSRLWLAGTPNEPTTVWASRTGNPFDFTAETDSQVLATDRIKIPAATKGAIRWMAGRQALLFGTEMGEHSVTASSGMLAPGDFQVRQESAFGSAAVQSVDLGDQVLFCSRDRRKVRGIDYSLDKQAWQAHDLTFVAEHLTRALVGEMHFARDPGGTLALLALDGSLICATIDREAQVLAWWTADLGGDIVTGAVLNGPEGSVLYIVVQRGDAVCLEYLPMGEHHPDRDYLDASVRMLLDEDGPPEWDAAGTYVSGQVVAWKGLLWECYALPEDFQVGVEPGTNEAIWVEATNGGGQLSTDFAILAGGGAAIYGLDHLEGQTVEVVQDGARGEPVVVSSGRIQVPFETGSVTVGLPYSGRVVLLPPAPQGARGGPSLRSTRRWVSLFLRLNASALPLVEGERISPDRRDGTALDAPEAPWTGDFGGPITASLEARGSVTITTDLPFRTEILAVFGSLDHNEV